jgi:hypothetical protein
MLGVRGGSKAKKNSSGKNRSRRMKGGNSPLPLSPASLAAGDHLGATPPAGGDNQNFNPAGGWYSNQVGGGYGFVDSASSISEVPSFAGSYFPVSRVCTAAAPDNNSRGGNNFDQGGGAGSPSPFSPSELGGGGKKKRKGGSSKKKGGTMKKWKQRGCNRKGGSRKKNTKKGGKRK